MVMKDNWFEINPPQDAERSGLAFIREALPGQEPYFAWSNFEFVDEHGNIYEIDLLLLTPKGFFHIELKNFYGAISGNDYDWEQRANDRTYIHDNPLLLANTKSKRLISRLKKELPSHRRNLPFLETLIFLCHPSVKNDLPHQFLLKLIVISPISLEHKTK